MTASEILFQSYDGLEVGAVSAEDERITPPWLNEPVEAPAYWCVWGHVMEGGGCEDLRDFDTREEALAWAVAMVSKHPSLQIHGVMADAFEG